jgi:hypothetical protein
MMRKTLLAVVLTATAFAANADYKCSVNPRDDVILSPQTVQVKGENGNLILTPEGNVTFNGKQYSLALRSASRRRITRLNCAAPYRGSTKVLVHGREKSRGAGPNHRQGSGREQQHARSPDKAGCPA